MSLKDRFNAMLHKKDPDARSTMAQSAQQVPDFYSGIKKADEELYEAATHLQTLADDILAESTRRNPDATQVVAEYTASCNKVATDWINSNYSLPPFLADAYGKSWLTDNARDMFETVCKASAVADPQVKSSLKQAMHLIAIAAAAMVIHGLFNMSGNAAAPTATRNAVEATAAAKTFIFGL